MINVLYIIWSLGLGGAEQVVISLARGLDKSKFRPFICCLNDEGRFSEELKKEGIQVFALNKVKGIDFSVVPKLVKIIRDNNIQVVHTHLWGANFWGRFAANAAKVPVVITEHNVDVWKSPLHFLIDKYLFKKTDCFIAVSETVRNFYAQKLGVAKERIKVVYNGVDVRNAHEGRWTRDEGRKDERTKDVHRQQTTDDRQNTLREEFGIKSDEKVISVIGRLVPQKGIEFFLNAMKEVLNHRPSTMDHRLKILIVGDGLLLESLKLQASSCKLKDKIIFTGFRKDVREILSITDILVLPSSREGLPIILLEAMAEGAIVVATCVGGTPELVQDGENGFLVEYGDVEGLQKILVSLLDGLLQATGYKLRDEKTKDEGRGTRDEKRKNEEDLAIDEIRNNAKRTVEEKFSLEKMVLEHQEIYRELIADRD